MSVKLGISGDIRTVEAIDGADRDIIGFYTAGGSEGINGVLRGTARPWDGVEARIAALDRAVAKARLDDCLLFRGIGPRTLQAYFKNGLAAGTILTERTFLNTSRDPDVAMRFAAASGSGTLMTIILPRGIFGLSVMAYSNFPDEDEVILRRGTRLIVTGYSAATRSLFGEVLS